MAESLIAQRQALLGDLIKSELANLNTRESYTAVGGTRIEFGQVVAVRTSDGKLLPYDGAATDGTQNPIGVLIGAPPDVNQPMRLAIPFTLAVDTPVAVLDAGPAVLARSRVLFKAGTTAAQTTSAISVLKVRSIVVKLDV